MTNFARVKTWKTGDMTPAAVDYELDALYRNMNSIPAGASTTASYLTVSTEAGLAGSRRLAGTANQITATDAGAGSTLTLSLPNPLTIPGVINIPNTDLQIAGNQVLPILQIVRATTSTEAAITSTTFANSNLAGSITPRLSTSKILIYVCGTLQMSTGDAGAATIARGTTNLAAGTSGFFTAISNNNYCVSMLAYDSPATTSATTYNVQLRTNAAAATIKFPLNTGAGTSEASILLIEIAQ